MKCYKSLVNNIEILHSLDDAQKARVESLLSWGEYAKRDQVVVQEDQSTDVYFLGTGRVRATIYSPSGREITYQDLDAGKMFGELSAIDSEPRSVNVVVLEKSKIASISAKDFAELLQNYPVVSMAVLKHFSATVRGLSNRVFELRAMNVKGRVYQELCRLAEKQGMNVRVVIENMPSHTEIANRVSTHREAVTRALGELQRTGVATRRSNRQFVISDVAKLKQMAHASFE